MGYFTQPTLTVTLNDDEPEATKRNSVVLRKWTAKERQLVSSLSMAPIDVIATQIAVKDGGRPTILIDMPRQRIESVKVCVQSWSGPDFEGLPVSPENVERLPPDILDTLADACDQLNQGLSDDLKNASGKPTSGGS